MPTAHQAGSVEATVATGQTSSLIYEPYYGLKEKPFSLSADPRFFYKSPSHSSAFNDLLAAIRRREGLVVLTGDIGTGKTTLCRTVLERLDRKTFTTFVPDPSVSREDLLKILLVDFGVVSVEDVKNGVLKGTSRPDLSYPLYEFLISLVPLQAFAVLIIDEAQNLSSPSLEEIRILLDLEGREKLLQVILVGQPDLRSQLKLPRMRQVDQRVSMRCQLEPLSREAVAGYVAHRLNVAGGGSERIEFSGEALDVVYRGSGGVPRLINLICDRALQRGCLARTARIESEAVSSAVTDLALSVSPTSEAPEPIRFHTAPRSLFEKASARTEELPTKRDLEALLELAPLSPREAGLPATEPQAEHPEPISSDPAIARPAEGWDIRRPEDTSAARRWWGRERPRARRVSPLVTVLLWTALAGLVGAGLGYLQGMRQSLVDQRWVTYLPPPALFLKVPGFEAQSPPDPTLVADLLEAQLAAREGSLASAKEIAEAYVIQVASFESSERASPLVSELMKAGYGAYQTELDLGPRGRVQQVLVGRYGTRAEAESDLAQIHRVPGCADARVLGVLLSRLSP